MMHRLFKRDKMAESFVVAMLLAMVGGYLDIYCYLARGKVFANTQTGNLVLLGYNIAQGNMHKVIYYLFSIFSFMTGVCSAKCIEYKFKEGRHLYWLHISLCIEMMALFIVMFIREGSLNVIANVIVSFVCGLQVQSFRKVNGKAYSTIMFTGNLKNLADHFSHYIITKEKASLENGSIYLGVTLAFVIGGWLGALTTDEYGVRAVGLVNIILALVFVVLYQEKHKAQYQKHFKKND